MCSSYLSITHTFPLGLALFSPPSCKEGYFHIDECPARILLQLFNNCIQDILHSSRVNGAVPWEIRVLDIASVLSCVRHSNCMAVLRIAIFGMIIITSCDAMEFRRWSALQFSLMWLQCFLLRGTIRALFRGGSN